MPVADGTLEAKVRCIEDNALGVRLMLVAGSQRRTAEEFRRRLVVPDDGVEIVGVTSLEEAFGIVFEDARSLPHVDPNIVATRLFRLALSERSASLHWGPIRRSAELTLATGEPPTAPETQVLDEEAELKLSAVRAIAARHDNIINVPMPDVSPLLRTLAPQAAARLLAHVFQHAADTGQPDQKTVDGMRVLVASRDDVVESSADSLRVRGAHARMLSALGRYGEAAGEQERLARAWLDSHHDDRLNQVSYPLSEFFRLSGLNGDRTAFARAEGIYNAAKDEHEALVHSPWVLWYRGVANVLLGDPAAATDDLRSARGQPHAIQVTRFSCLRWLARAARMLGRPKQEERELQSLREARYAVSVEHEHRTQTLLAELDAMIAVGGTGQHLEATLAQLRRTCPAFAVFERRSMLGTSRLLDAYPY